MAKLSELSEADLNKFIARYSKKIIDDADDEAAQEKLTKLKKELKKRGSGKSSVSKKVSAQAPIENSGEDAGFVPRFAALIIDAIILGVLSGILNYAITFAAKIPGAGLLLGPLLLIVNLVIPVIYSIHFLRSHNGQTIGKRLLSIRVISTEYDGPLTVQTIIMREFLGKLVSGVIFLLGYLMPLISKKTWHDSIAATNVIKA